MTGLSQDAQNCVQVGDADAHAKDTAYLPDKQQAGGVLLQICLKLSYHQDALLAAAEAWHVSSQRTSGPVTGTYISEPHVIFFSWEGGSLVGNPLLSYQFLKTMLIPAKAPPWPQTTLLK